MRFPRMAGAVTDRAVAVCWTAGTGGTDARVRRREFIALLGGVAAWPLAARAQSGVKSHRVSFLALVPREDETLMKALLERLHELGYSEGTNLIFEYRSAEGTPDRLGQLAMELVQAKPDVLVAGFGTLAAKAAKAATTTIPVVFTTVGDPLGAGIIANLARPGGNVTGLTDQARDVQGKRLQLLLELLPGKNETRAQPSDFGTGCYQPGSAVFGPMRGTPPYGAAELLWL